MLTTFWGISRQYFFFHSPKEGLDLTTNLTGDHPEHTNLESLNSSLEGVQIQHDIEQIYEQYLATGAVIDALQQEGR